MDPLFRRLLCSTDRLNEAAMPGAPGELRCARALAGKGRVYSRWFARARYGLELCEDSIADRKPGYLGFVVVSVVVVLPPSRSVSVFVWVSVLPAIPSRWTSFSITVLPFLSTSLWIVTSR